MSCNMNEVIKLEETSKAFPIYAKPSDMIKEIITRRCRHDLFWALRDISFSVSEGQRIGVIGPNGSGKSTLLKIIVGNLQPTSGRVMISGRISAMLSLATALNLEEDGISNIKFNLLLNGCGPKEVPSLIEEIIDFTELGPFIYSPVKTYSSGMNARLAFAIATTMRPEILVIDEVLSVGDGYFVGKAIQRMIRLCEEGRALVLVSHNIADVRKLCDTVIWLENGSIRKMGATEEICREYEEDYTKKRDASERPGNIARQKTLRLGAVNIDSSDSGIQRLRIVPQGYEKEFSDIHYIRNIQLHLGDDPPIELPLELTSPNHEKPACLDVLESEWGRLYNRYGEDCRILFCNSGKAHGGHLLFHLTGISLACREIAISCSLLVSSRNGTEKLSLEYFDYRIASWRRITDSVQTEHDKHWDSLNARFMLPIASPEEFERAREIVSARAKPAIEIVDVAVYSNGKRTSVIQERQPFCIAVMIHANRTVPCVDVIINLYKSDGTYVFFQSSGMNPENMYDTSHNIRNLTGAAKVSFDFDPNFLNAGQYEVHVYCANGFDLANNLPQSEQYDVKIGAVSFTVLTEFSQRCMDFGQLNMRVPVDIEILDNSNGAFTETQ